MKGITFSLEVIISLGLIAISAVAIFSSLPTTSVDTSKQQAYNAVAWLDSTGELRELVALDDTSTIRTRLQPWLDDFELEICDTNCIGTARRGAIALDWYVSGFLSYNPKRLRVYVFV